MRKFVILVVCAGLLAASCGDDATVSTSSGAPEESSTSMSEESSTSMSEESSTSMSEESSTTSEATTTLETTTSTAPTTTTTAPPPGSYPVEAIDTCVIGSSPGQQVNVRSGPGSASGIVGTLAEDAVGVHTSGWAADDSHGDAWRQIVFGGEFAWVFSAFLTPGVCTLGAPVAYCTNEPACTDVPNVRTGLGVGYQVVTTLPRNASGVAGTGATAEDGQGRAWVQVHQDGKVGWVAGWLLDPEPCSPTSCSPPALPWIITAEGAGPITMGMPIGNLEYLTGFTWTWEEPGAEDCLWGSTVSVDAHIQADDGALVDHLAIYQAGAAVTEAGIHVGSTRAALNAAYGADVLEFKPWGYGDYGAFVDLNDDGVADMLAMFDNSGLLTPIMSIRLPAILIEGGCL